mgnify:CR=1 FL=1
MAWNDSAAHHYVLAASLRLAERLDRAVVIEATSNQVNQDGGYTGMRPADFIGFVRGLADGLGVARERVLFGGDHLGPQAWRKLPAEAAMAKAHVMVADYVEAGFSKVHLDCSEGCAGEPAQLSDAMTVPRAALQGGAVFVLVGKAARLTPVTVIEWPAARLIVTEGLAEGDAVIVDATGLTDGQIVTPVDPATDPATAVP